MKATCNKAVAVCKDLIVSFQEIFCSYRDQVEDGMRKHGGKSFPLGAYFGHAPGLHNKG